VETAASAYEEKLLPPFFDVLEAYATDGNLQFDCPGHQQGAYYRKHPVGRRFYEFLGENVFLADLCNADVTLGDLLIHDGPPEDATKYAAEVFNADRTYFIMNGTTTSNTAVISAIVASNDLILFDRNNHKSAYDAALIRSGGIPIYLETARNPFGFRGGIDERCFDETYIRERTAAVSPGKAKMERPFRLAIIQLGTYDGTIYNARRVVDTIGHLCDYILFDSAWVGYEQFIPMMRDCSPLLLELGADDPGIFVTQSVHKQQAGFSQSSYIHKKDGHIRGQRRYINHERFNNFYRLTASTSPFYPLYAGLAVNAAMQAGAAGRRLWDECVKMGIEARKSVIRNCKFLRPFIPPEVHGRPWEDYDTDIIAQDITFFRFEPNAKWHAFKGYGEGQYFVDPNKFMLVTPGIDVNTGDYEDFGIPAAILAHYLRSRGIIPEKSDFNSILFLLTPAETPAKMDALISELTQFEAIIERNEKLSEVLPQLYRKNAERYRGYGIRDLCMEMHTFYRESDAKTYQERLFRTEYLPEMAMNPFVANMEYVRNNTQLVPIREIEGEIALEGALPYPPGILCVVPGEVWNDTARKYFLILEEGINRFPGFSPEIHGVHFRDVDGRSTAFGYVHRR
jgi:ornithine decarboxylase